MKRTMLTLIGASFLFGTGQPSYATGGWYHRQVLANGGKSLLDAPEFFSEIELKLLAREFPTPFKAVRFEHPQKRNAELDLEEFDAAIKDGSIHPPDADAARAAHKRMRGVLGELAGLTAVKGQVLPDDLLDDVLDDVRKQVFPSEFADYHEGCIAYAKGDHPAARAVWERLLARPEKERRYRSVSAAFMIGVLASVDNLDDAPQWLEKARELAQKGFPDSTGLAAASYDWEAQWHHQRGELHNAAVASLRAISTGYAKKTCAEPANDTPEELAKFATDPLLRRIQTSLLLSQYGAGNMLATDADSILARWLAALEAAKVKDFVGAERVAWMCYTMGDFPAATRWLARASSTTPESLWLAGKLAARDGRKEDSYRAMSAATRLLAGKKEPELEVTITEGDAETPQQVLHGDQGVVALGAAEFRMAFDAFLRGGHWVDAAYVAERLMTVSELQAIVAKRPWQAAWDAIQTEDFQGDRQTRNLRWLLARRLTRLGRFAEARPFFPAESRAWLDTYTQALAEAKRPTLSREAKALAYWKAALEARYHGRALFGTEAAPDWFAYDGQTENDDPAASRTGRSENPVPIVLQAGAAERQRLQKSIITPDKRFHYRYRAGDLAWQAARLLPDNDQRLAEILDLAGRWLAPRDAEAAERFYQALEKRCAATEIGKRATAKRWFVDIPHYTIPTGPKPPSPETEPAP